MENDEHKSKAQLIRELAAAKSELAEVKSQLDRSHFFDLLVENLPHYVVCKDLDGVFTYANPKYCKRRGIPLSEFIGKNNYDLHTKKAAEKFRALDAEVVRTGRVVTSFEEHLPLKGVLMKTQLIKAPIYDRQGQIVGVISVFWDISKFKRVENALRESEAKYRSVIENIQDVFYRTDAAGRLIMISPSFLKVLGYASYDQVLGKAMTSFYLHPTQFCDVLKELEQNGSSKEYEATLLKQDGTPVIVSKNSNYYFDSAGKPLGVEGIFRDVTEQHRTYEALCKAKNEMEEAYRQLKETDRMKTHFVSMVSHELRTPLTSILGFSEMIRLQLQRVISPHFSQKGTNEYEALCKIFRDIQIVISESERMASLIDDTLDITRLESEEIPWRRQRIDIVRVVDRALAATTPLFAGQNVKLLSRMGENLPAVAGDEDRIVQVLINLISNAFKFTKEGTVCCSAEQYDDSVRIAVSDTGRGIPASGHKRIFEVFTQLGDTLTDKPKGSGLGLSICKHIIKHHGGDIWVESEEGKGSTFIFSLPTAGSESAKEPHMPFSFDALLEEDRLL